MWLRRLTYVSSRADTVPGVAKLVVQVPSAVLARLEQEARALDHERERLSGDPPLQRTSAGAAAALLLRREFERRDAKAARARRRRRG
jgi:hypothetical protein